MIQTRQITEPDDQLRGLIRLLDELMISLYPPESNHLLPLETLFSSGAYMVGAFKGDELLGCGAVLIGDDGAAEMKRMMLSPEHRGGSVAVIILAALESHLGKSGVRTLRLETGIHQRAALAFFRKNGFRDIAAFGDYQPDLLSVFMEKAL